MIIYTIFFILKFFLGVESGASFPWSSKWQSKTVYGHSLRQLPEALDALLLSFITLEGYKHLGFKSSFHYEFAAYIAVFAIIYAGIQSATWMFLKWTDHEPNKERDATLKPAVDFIADKIGFSLGEEGYSWVAATVKGTIITLPMGGLGGILFALGYEAGSHFPEKYKAIASEGLSFVGVGIYAALFFEVCKVLGIVGYG